MPGPLVTMFGEGRRENEEDFARFRAANPDWGADDVSRAIFNTRLNMRPMNTGRSGRVPGDDAGPIILDQAVDAEMPLSAILPPVNSAITPQRGLPPRAFRDPMQAGPQPPTGGGSEDILFYPDRNVIEEPRPRTRGPLASLYRR